jgi:hypothetical protein
MDMDTEQVQQHAQIREPRVLDGGESDDGESDSDVSGSDSDGGSDSVADWPRSAVRFI